MSDHRHEWPVDAACDCGLMISENSQAQAAQITALEAEMKRLRTMCSELEAEVGRWKDYELSKDIAEIKSGYADFAPFVALAKAIPFAIGDLGPARRHIIRIEEGRLLGNSPIVIREIGQALDRCIHRLEAALAHPDIQRAIQRLGES